MGSSTKIMNATSTGVPTLSKHLLEGAFAQCMSQVLMSLDQCRLHAKTGMSLEDHVRDLSVIASGELETALMLVRDRHAATMVKKHVFWVHRSRATLRRLASYDLSAETVPESTYKSILGDVVLWIQDAHLILHEDTPNKTRDYLASKLDDEA